MKTRVRIFVKSMKSSSHLVCDDIKEYENPYEKILVNAAKHNAAITIFGEDSYQVTYADGDLEFTVIINILSEES